MAADDGPLVVVFGSSLSSSEIVIEVEQNFLGPRMLANLESRLLGQDLNALKAINTLKTSFFSCSDEAFT